MPQAGRSTQLGLICETSKDISEPLARAGGLGGWRMFAFAGKS